MFSKVSFYWFNEILVVFFFFSGVLEGRIVVFGDDLGRD